MFNRDLIARYGEGTGVREKELREALKFRRITFSFFGLIVLAAFGGLFFIDPMAPVYLLFVIGGVGLIFGIVLVSSWIIENWTTMMDRIHNAKTRGVLEDKR